jgi:hypothetical protein
MKEQNFNNHAQMVPGFHYLTFGGIIALLGGSINYFLKASAENKYLAALLVLASIIFILVAWFTRTFALKAQDALRFAPDAEFPALAEKAATNNLSGKEIKQSIQNWKADFYRV